MGKNENLISTRIIQQLEIDHHLTKTKGPELVASPSPASLSRKSPPQKPIIAIPKPKKLSRNEAMMEKYKGELSPKSVIQEALEALLVDKPSTTDFVMQLAANNICSGQQKLATALEFFQYRFSDSFGGNPPL